jgi:phenylalanyl-tRNA synthetase alpha chain
VGINGHLVDKADKMTSQDLGSLKSRALASIAGAADLSQLEAVKVEFLGKKGSISALLRQIGEMPEAERKSFAAAVNLLRDAVEEQLAQRKAQLSDSSRTAALARESDDMTMPVRPLTSGTLSSGTVHPIQQTIQEMVAIFSELGFSWAEGPDVETDWNNFTALNMPENHPARQMQDTFYMPTASNNGQGATLLRTQTSGVQIRVMSNNKPPIRIVAPGRTYRSDYDQTHTPMFHQIEGLMIDESTTFAHLKGLLYEFVRRFFGVEELNMQFRPSYFPFTEPSAEVDIGCSRSGGKIKIGAGSDWLEVLGCGMVHPQVLKNCGLDPTRYQGFAFGMGIERFAMLKHGISDLREMFNCDLRWMRRYGFSPTRSLLSVVGASQV